MTGIGGEAGARAARSRALAVLRIRGRALGVALLPAAAEVILLTGGATGQFAGPGWDLARWIVGGFALVVLLAAAGVALVVARARPAETPTVPVSERAAPDLYRLVRDLAERLDVPAPSAIALTPDCDSWLEDRTHPAHGPPPRETAATPTVPGLAPGDAPGGAAPAPVLVIGSPFLWWMRVAELRAVLAPVVAGTGPSAQPDIAAARRFVRGLDAAVAVSATSGRGPLTRGVCGALGWVARLLLRACREHAVLMERGVAAAAAERAQSVDYGPRIVAQEQVGLAYAGWDRLLTRVALPAWRMGRWPSRLDAGVVAALTELSRRDRLADGFTSRLGERPACDLLEEPGVADEAVSLLAARLFHGAPTGPGPQWSPVDWHAYPEEVVDRTWRAEAARLHRVLDGLPDRPPASGGATLARVLDHLAAPAEVPGRRMPEDDAPALPASAHTDPDDPVSVHTDPDDPVSAHTDPDDPDPTTERGSALAAGLSAELAREESTVPRGATASGLGRDPELWDEGALPLFPLQPPRTGRELLVAHVTAMVCCAAVDSAGAAPGLDWLDGPTLLLDGKRATDLGPRVLSLIEEGNPGPLRDWLAAAGIRPEKPVRLG